MIDKLLLNASKRALERAIQNLSFVQMIIPIFNYVIECKRQILKNMKVRTWTSIQILLLMGFVYIRLFLSKEFDVLAIAVSGENESELKVSQFYNSKALIRHKSFLGQDILSLKDCHSAILQSDMKLTRLFKTIRLHKGLKRPAS